jgi:hypothetical protein
MNGETMVTPGVVRRRKRYLTPWHGSPPPERTPRDAVQTLTIPPEKRASKPVRTSRWKSETRQSLPMTDDPD